MSSVLGNIVEEKNVKRDKEREVTLKEVIAYSGEKVVFSRIAKVDVFYDGRLVRIVEDDGTVTMIYNAVVVVKERPKR